MTAVPKGAVIEIIDASVGDGPMLPSRILINGVDVGLIDVEGFDLSRAGASFSGPLVMTLRLLPSRIVFRHEDAVDIDAEKVAAGSITVSWPGGPSTEAERTKLVREIRDSLRRLDAQAAR